MQEMEHKANLTLANKQGVDLLQPTPSGLWQIYNVLWEMREVHHIDDILEYLLQSVQNN